MSIVGSAPPRFYVSGPYAEVMTQLDGQSFGVFNLGGEIGRAASLKMCSAALIKCTQALWVAVLAAARQMDLWEPLIELLEYREPAALAQMRKKLPAIYFPKGHRWVTEMEEIAATFETLGMTPRFHKGAADICRLLERMPKTQKTRDEEDQDRVLGELVAALAECATKEMEEGHANPA